MRTVIGVMGGGNADAATMEAAHRVGVLVAESGWVLLNGGRDAGVMRASAAGASSADGLTVGLLPDEDTAQVAPGIDIAIPTGMGDARNVLNVLASNVVIAMRGGAGTISEVAHALKLGRPVVAIDFRLGPEFDGYRDAGRLTDVTGPEEAIVRVHELLDQVRS